MRRVVVTGIGLLTTLGNNKVSTWNNLLEGKSGIKKVNQFDVSDLPCKIAGYLSNEVEDDNYFNKPPIIDTKDIKRNDRFIQYGLVAASMAVEDAGINNLSEEDKLNVGISVGSGIGGLETIYNGSLTISEKGPKRLSPFFIPSSLVNLLPGQISIKYGFKGPNHSVVTACASGAHAIGDSFRIISYGDADVMIAGGTEAACTRFGISGFCAMRALSTKFNDDPEKASRPWDKDRDGFVLSEGSGMLVLEELEHAKKRSAKIYAEIIGYGLTGDAFHPTAPASDGSGGFRAMKMALNNAKISSDQIDYINAHGTSTPLGDEIEFNAVKRIFENNKKKLFMSSTKSSTGHLLGASGAIESIFSILSLQDGIIPPTLNLTNPSSDCEGINLVPNESINNTNNFSLSNSFGFGGTNVSLIFKKK